MVRRTSALAMCLAFASCSDVEPPEGPIVESVDIAPSTGAPVSGLGADSELTVERARSVLEAIDSRLQFVQQAMEMPGLPRMDLFCAGLEEDGITIAVNIGFRGQEAEFTHLKISLEAQAEGQFIPDQLVAKFVAGFVEKAMDDGEKLWTELVQQPDLLGVPSQISIIQRIELENYFVTLVRRGNMSDSQFRHVEFDIATREYQKELESQQLQRFMPGAK